MLQSFPDLSRSLILWYLQTARDLPWRRTRDPYAIWVSEIMLQQTQVVTVLPYYERFLTQFPTIGALANAPLDAVIKTWEGLGYYARARNLHKAAQWIMYEHAGQFPRQLAEVQALPGIGESTAGAILSFACGQAHPILDGNVKRVLSRVFAVQADIQKPATLKTLWAYSRQLVDASEDVYSLNQALMELGATHCSNTPQCLLCPWQTACQARALGLEKELPLKTAKPKSPHFNIGAAVIWQDEQVYIQQRPENGLLGGLWEFPGGKQEADESLEATVIREIREELNIDIKVGQAYPPIKHAYTHFKITLFAFDCVWTGGIITTDLAYKWVSIPELSAYAFPKANQAILETLRKRQPTKTPTVAIAEAGSLL